MRVIVHILNFSQTMIPIENEYQMRAMELVNNLMIEIFVFIAQEERALLKISKNTFYRFVKE